MKKHFERPSIESCEFVVAARLQSSGGIGGAHSNAPNSPCSKVASNGPNSCAPPSNPSSAGGNLPCVG